MWMPTICPQHIHNNAGPGSRGVGQEMPYWPPRTVRSLAGPPGCGHMAPDHFVPLSRLFVFLLTWHTVRFRELFWTISSGLSPFRLMSSLWLADDIRHNCKTPAGGPDIKRGGEPIRALPCCFLLHAQTEAKEYCLYLGYGWIALAGQAVSL